MLKQNGVLLMTGHAGTGKSRIGRHILHLFCKEDNSYKCIKLNTLKEWENMVSRQNKVIVLLDDIFGETNCIYDRETDTPILDKLHAYVRKGNIKLIITIRDTVTRQCREVFENHRLFKFDFIDLSSDKYKLSNEEKQDILTIYMKTVKKSDYLEAEGFTDCNGVTILRCAEVRQIITETPVKGFPLVVYQFVHNNKYFQLGSKFFVMPTEAILEEINELRRKGEIDKKCMIQYAVMVYTAVNENRINPGDGSNTFEVVKIIDAIYGKSIKLKKCNISDSVKYLLGSYLVNIPNQRSYRFHHTTLQESVILSFAQIDDENLKKIIPLLSWSFFLKMVKSNDYKEKEGEVVLRIPTNSFELLAARLVTIYEAKLWNNIVDAKLFIYCFINTEICLQDDCILLIYFLDALEKEDYKNKHTENMIKSNAWFSCFSHLKRTNMFIAILVNLKQSKYILQKFDQEIKTSKNHFSIDFMKAALVSSMYESCSTKDLRSVEAIFHLSRKNKIPVLLDQGTINLVDIGLTKIIFDEYQYDLSDARCIFLSLCIWKAYEAFNVPVLEFLLSKYNRTPFDVNSFFEMIYRNEHVNYWLEKRTQPNGIISDRSLISFKQLKWMIDRFADIELVHTECLLRTACQLQMLDTVEYLASLCINFDVIFCLKISLGVNDEQQFCDKDLFEFLLSKTDSSSTDLIPVVILVLQRMHVPDYIFDAFIQLCLNNEDILTLACKNAHLYFATLLMEKGQNVDIQSALIATCMKTEGKCNKCSVYSLMRYVDMEFEKLELVKNIIGKFGYGKFDLKTVCQHAYNAGYFKIIEWFVQNIDITMLDVYFIIKSALIGKQSDLLEYIMTKTDIASLDKMEVFKCVTEHYTVECSTTILEIVSIIWEGTENKEELKFEEMVDTAYERKDFELLMRIHEKYCSYVSIDARKLLMSASENCRTDVAKWVFRNFSLASSDIDEGKLLMLACANDLAIDLKRCDMVKWILNSFKINPLNLKSGVLKLLNHDKYFMQELTDEIFNLVVYILENYPICPSKEDIKIMICKSQERRGELVNWFLQHDISCLLDKQNILNTACMRSEIKTIKLLTNYFSSLDMHQAMIHACTSNTLSSKTYYDNQIACLDLFWKQFDHDSNDINIIVSTVCKANSISNNCMTWVLLNLPHDKVSTNKLLIACCKQGKINHVKYIFNIHKENNGQLDIEEALRQACSSCSEYQSFETIFTRLLLRKYNKTIICRIKRNKGMLVDYLFKRLRDKQSNVPIVFNDLIAENRYDLILYFLEEGCCRNMDMKSLMKQACRHGHVKLVQWILENIEQAELDIKSALFELCKCTEKCKLTELDTISGSFDKCSVVSVKKHCLALIWHYVQDIEMFEMDTVLKAITEVPPDMSGMYDELRNWIQYIQNINQIRIRISESALLNSEEDKKQRRQQIYDDQNSKMLKDTLHINESSSSDDCPVELKRLRLEKE
ncbi:unnamed protein product [Mytilus edulis]|uniref:Novel STAND NTPase 3 domain-containing protein n=1 Tax=Mytilus edulis TaxID=6550 RepID=A0A8S3QUN9_MYTED|nr:unnamed protein product [Mytilus edulis]